MRPATLALRTVKREIGVAQQFFHRASIARTEGRADARPDIEQVIVDLVRLGQSLNDIVRQLVDAFAIGCFAQHHGELVAAQPPADLAVAHQALQPRRDFGQHAVADQVPKRVVDRLEAVEIDHHQRTARTPCRSMFERLAQSLVEHAPVRKLRQRIVAREVSDFFR